MCLVFLAQFPLPPKLALQRTILLARLALPPCVRAARPHWFVSGLNSCLLLVDRVLHLVNPLNGLSRCCPSGIYSVLRLCCDSVGSLVSRRLSTLRLAHSRLSSLHGIDGIWYTSCHRKVSCRSARCKSRRSLRMLLGVRRGLNGSH